VTGHEYYVPTTRRRREAFNSTTGFIPSVAYCVEDGCRNEATSSRLVETFAPVVVNGTEADQTVELVCEDHT
jgi:hypothetical protein